MYCAGLALGGGACAACLAAGASVDLRELQPLTPLPLPRRLARAAAMLGHHYLSALQPLAPPRMYARARLEPTAPCSSARLLLLHPLHLRAAPCRSARLTLIHPLHPRTAPCRSARLLLIHPLHPRTAPCRSARLLLLHPLHPRAAPDRAAQLQPPPSSQPLTIYTCHPPVLL